MAQPVDAPEAPKSSGSQSQAPVAPTLPPQLQRLKQLLQASGGLCQRRDLSYQDFLRRLCEVAAQHEPEAARSKVSFTMNPMHVPQLSLRARRHAVASAAQRRLSAAAKAAAAAGTVVMVDDEHEEKVSAEKMKECQVAQAPELAEIFSDAATCVVLLRRYLSQAQWVGTLNGALIFEKDGVLYPLETTTPVRESATAGAELLSLGSLFAIATFHGHLGSATPKLLKSLKAKKLPPSRHLLELADYLLGRRDTCCLLLSSSKAKEVSPARPSRTVLPKGRGEPTPLEELKCLPGQVESDESEVENES
ncbi:unnamed protein product, partial [Cladocopium goreaui]